MSEAYLPIPPIVPAASQAVQRSPHSGARREHQRRLFRSALVKKKNTDHNEQGSQEAQTMGAELTQTEPDSPKRPASNGLPSKRVDVLA